MKPELQAKLDALDPYNTAPRIADNMSEAATQEWRHENRI